MQDDAHSYFSLSSDGNGVVARFAVPQQAEGEISIYTMQGQQVQTIRLGVVASGAEYFVPLEGIGQGAYLCRLQVGNYYAVQKVIRK